MEKISQKEAVYRAVTETLGSKFNEGQAVALTDEERTIVVERVKSALAAGTVPFRTPSKLEDASYLSTYASGLVANWLRRDARLSGKKDEAQTAAA